MKIVNNAITWRIAFATHTAVIIVAVSTSIVFVLLVILKCLGWLLVLSEIVWLLLTWHIGNSLNERLLRAGGYRRVRKHGLLQMLVVSLEQPHVRFGCQT